MGVAKEPSVITLYTESPALHFGEMKARMTSTNYDSQRAGFEQLTVRDASLTCNVRLVITLTRIHAIAGTMKRW